MDTSNVSHERILYFLLYAKEHCALHAIVLALVY
jgi:hypothetical protein